MAASAESSTSLSPIYPCDDTTHDDYLCDQIKKLLPDGFQYRLSGVADYSSASAFNATIRTTIADAETSAKWRQDFEEKSKVTWRLLCGKVAKGKVNVYKRYYRCERNTMPRSSTADERSGSKNTDCPATMIMTVKRTDFKRKSRATNPDPFLPDYPCKIDIRSNHNHPIESADSLRKRDASEDALGKLQTNVTEQIMLAATTICRRVERNPSLLPSASKFANMVNDLRTDSALDSALAGFGKHTGLSVATKTSKLHGAKIGGQPTAVARRKSALGGRKCPTSGRNPKMSNYPLKRESKSACSVLPERLNKMLPAVCHSV